MTVEALMKAVRAGDVAEVRAMLAAHPDLVNAAAAGSPGFTPLHHAVFQRSPAMARLLMESGANPHAGISPLEDATTPLTMAVERGYDDVASVINEEMARRPVVDGLPNEFRAAAQALDEDRLLALLESHPEALRFASPGDRVTVLHVSSAALLLRVAGWLLDHGADVNAEAADGSTPLGVAGQRRRASENYAEAVATMRALLQGRGASYTARAAVMAGDEEFLRARYNEDRLEPAGLLALAVDHDRLAILRFLLDCGLDPDARETVDVFFVGSAAVSMRAPRQARHGRRAARTRGRSEWASLRERHAAV